MPPRLILHCTAKLIRELPRILIQADLAKGGPGEAWCLNLLRIEKKKCLLATDEATLYSVFIPNLRRADLKDLPGLLIPAVQRALAADGLHSLMPSGPVSAVISPADVRLRSVLGCMKEIAFESALEIERQGGLARSNPAAVSRFVNGCLHRTKGQPYATARERLLQLADVPEWL